MYFKSYNDYCLICAGYLDALEGYGDANQLIDI